LLFILILRRCCHYADAALIFFAIFADYFADAAILRHASAFFDAIARLIDAFHYFRLLTLRRCFRLLLCFR
jgi:hypothetical protein